MLKKYKIKIQYYIYTPEVYNKPRNPLKFLAPGDKVRKEDKFLYGYYGLTNDEVVNVVRIKDGLSYRVPINDLTVI